MQYDTDSLRIPVYQKPHIDSLVGGQRMSKALLPVIDIGHIDVEPGQPQSIVQCRENFTRAFRVAVSLLELTEKDQRLDGGAQGTANLIAPSDLAKQPRRPFEEIDRGFALTLEPQRVRFCTQRARQTLACSELLGDSKGSFGFPKSFIQIHSQELTDLFGELLYHFRPQHLGMLLEIGPPALGALETTHCGRGAHSKFFSSSARRSRFRQRIRMKPIEPVASPRRLAASR